MDRSRSPRGLRFYLALVQISNALHRFDGRWLGPQPSSCSGMRHINLNRLRLEMPRNAESRPINAESRPSTRSASCSAPSFSSRPSLPARVDLQRDRHAVPLRRSHRGLRFQRVRANSLPAGWKLHHRTRGDGHWLRSDRWIRHVPGLRRSHRARIGFWHVRHP
jgi:hypothetical protein